MKKILLFLFILFSFESFCQTKQETLNWIIEKINKYGDTKYQEIKAISSDGILKFTQAQYITNCIITYIVDLNDIDSVDHRLGVDIRTDAAISVIFYTWSKNVKMIDCKGTSYINGFSLSLSWDKENNLMNRFHKAMVHLTTFNPHKAKEVF